MHRVPRHTGVRQIGRGSVAQSLARGCVPKAEPKLPTDLPITQPRYVGKDSPRMEDPLLITGKVEYGNDIRALGMLHAAILRSPHAHALIKSIDTTRAERLPGVAAVL